LHNTYWQTAIKFTNSILVVGMLLWIQDYDEVKDEDILEFILNIMIATSFATPFINLLFDPDYLLYKAKSIYGTYLAKSKRITQEELNIMFEYPELDLPDRYSAIFVVLLLSSLYTTALPICSLIGIAALSLNYIFEKYIIAKRTSIAKDLSGELSFKMTQSYSYCVLLFTISDYVWDKAFLEKEQTTAALWLTYIGFIVVILYFVFPFEWLVRELTKLKKDKVSSVRYSEIKFKFNNDYDKKNPISYVMALEEATENKQKQELVNEIVDYSVKYDLVDVVSKKRSKALISRRKFKKAATATRFANYLVKKISS